jgi:hypothetical protein
MEFIETHLFTRLILELLTDDEYHTVQMNLEERPDQGRVINGSGGLRKIRVAAKGKGKSGGARIIYYWAPSSARIYLLLAYPKNKKDDLNSGEILLLKALMERELGHG